MNAQPIRNMRIHFYGTQGSGSTFPSREERRKIQKLMAYDLIRQIFQDLARRTDKEGRLAQTIEDILQGPISKRALLAYLDTLRLSSARIYGGWTTCVRIETRDGFDIIFDCGSGFRNCARDLQTKWGRREERKLYIFGSHSHRDHTEGFDQAAVCFDPRNTLYVYGNRQFLRALDTHLGIFSRHVEESVRGVQTPIFYGLMPARFKACEIRDLEAQPAPLEKDSLVHQFHHMREPVRLGDTSVTAFEVCHPAPCFAYRIENGGRTFVFCTDHELRHGTDPEDPRQQASLEAESRLIGYAAGADLMYRDGQYLRIEYDGRKGIGSPSGVPRLDWGHSCIEDVQAMAKNSRIKKTLVGHHDPNRDWAERNWIDESLARDYRESGLSVELARAETTVDL
ncbi:MAG: MBL fold metallo-hydrolase [Acidobacteriota bacterium]